MVAQTTFSLEKFVEYSKMIQNLIPKEDEVTVMNTICSATKIRQEETKELSKKVDLMVIVGGKHSSNTKKLFQIAKENCAKAICVETASELNRGDFKEAKVVGVMAGASTPKMSIEEVESTLKKW